MDRISVCICTYRRNGTLEFLLRKLTSQQTGGLFDFSVVVVDNDATGTAGQTVMRVKEETRLDINYAIEPHQNIALARNRAIKNARGEYIAFIDDDEYPDAAWLAHLYSFLRSYRADGVLGPVLPCYETMPPPWVLKGRFFERPTHPNAYVLPWQNTRTGNALLRRDLFKDDSSWFDPTFGSGGEDRDFFKRKIAEGHLFLWCNDARVFETIPPVRWERRVLFKRALLRGKMSHNRSEMKSLSILYSAAAFILYTICLPVLFISGHHLFMKYLIKTCDHFGKLLALGGVDLVREKYITC